MPFHESFDPVYKAVSRAAKQCGFECFRTDKRPLTGSLLESMMLDILLAEILVADISTSNPNVLYELGIAHAFSKRTVLLSQDLSARSRPPFDISHMQTISYEMPQSATDARARRLQKDLAKILSSPDVHSNPVESALLSRRVRLSNHFREQFLWGFAKTLAESRSAEVAWIVSRQLYWERLDDAFFRDIFVGRILAGKRRELVLMPNSAENRRRKEDLLARHRATNGDIEANLRILLIDDDLPFSFLPTEITIYDPGTPKLRAILLEPMAREGADAENDALIAAAFAKGSARDLRLHNLGESTFDIALSRDCSERMSHAFGDIWNVMCERQDAASWKL